MYRTGTVLPITLCAVCVLLTVINVKYFSHRGKPIRPILHEPLFTDLILTRSRNFVNTVFYDESTKFFYKPIQKLATDSEVQHCLKAAQAYKKSGKFDKALKLFEHAIVIAPENPEVLNCYGECLEESIEDVVKADELYSRALAYAPDHKGALSNRRRTSCLVDNIDLRMFQVIDGKKTLLKERLKSGFDLETKKKLFYLHIHHTVAIEGNTMTIAELQYLIEFGKVASEKTIQEHNEVLGLELALGYLTVLTTSDAITLVDILEIYKRVMGHVDPLGGGNFRKHQVFVGGHMPPLPEKLPELMENYVEWLNSEEAHNMHPVRYAALAHYKLVDIHPFSDGNGRTSRLIMNLILLRSGYPPVIISKDDRKKYYDYLKIANKGDLRPFVRFIAYCTDATLNTYLGQKQLITHKIYESPVIEIESDE